MRKPTIAMLCAAALACGVSKAQYAAKELEASQAQRKLQDETDKTGALEAKVTDLEAQLALAKGEEMGRPKAKSAQYEQLTRSLHKQIVAGQVELCEVKGKTTVKMKEKLLFSPGSAKIGKAGQVALGAVAASLKDVSGKNAMINGYTDDARVAKKGGPHDSWDLSSARAIAVARYLVAKGVDPGMLGVGGFSERQPPASNGSQENRGQNRRIEIALSAAEAPQQPVDTGKVTKQPPQKVPAGMDQVK